MNDILYLKIEQNVVVHKNTVILKDIASLFCTDEAVSNKLKSLKIHIFYFIIFSLLFLFH